MSKTFQRLNSFRVFLIEELLRQVTQAQRDRFIYLYGVPKEIHKTQFENVVTLLERTIEKNNDTEENKNDPSKKYNGTINATFGSL